jgi:hypothetical protein
VVADFLGPNRADADHPAIPVGSIVEEPRSSSDRFVAFDQHHVDGDTDRAREPNALERSDAAPARYGRFYRAERDGAKRTGKRPERPEDPDAGRA